MKEINIIYDCLKEQTQVYQGPEGNVYCSQKRNANMHNVFQSYYQNPDPEDSYLMLEPIVVSPNQYNIEYLSKFKYIFGCFNKAFETSKVKYKYISVNYGSDLTIHSHIPDTKSIMKHWKSWNQRNGVVIIAGGTKDSSHPASIYNLRIMIADLLYKNNFEVAWYGQQHLSKPYYKGPIKDKIQIINNYRFAICSENTYDSIYSHNYLTEKLPHAIYGGAIPLYMGCYNIQEFVPQNTFFDLRQFVIRENNNITLLKQPFIDALNVIGEKEFKQYQDAEYAFIQNPNGLNYHTDPNRVYRKMLEIL